jgi:4-amino-4-deoxy-L-arabinose transferase-like glycosyltransferase
VSERTSRWLLVLLVAVFLGLGATYGLVIPCFEASDEWSHLTLARYYAAHRGLPPLIVPPRRAATGSDMSWFLEYHDPPLYYAPPLYYWLAGRLVSWADMDDLPYLMVPSPNWEVGWVPEPDGTPWNKNLYAHRAEESLAQSGTVQAAYLLRGASLGLGGVVVACTYALARLLWPDRLFLGLGAAAFVALNPKFITVSAGVTNDALLNALFALFLVGALRAMRDRAAWYGWAALGGVVGLAMLTKQSGLLLLPLGGLAVLGQWSGAISHWRRKAWADGAAFLATALGVGGWWYVRNAVLYDDPLGLGPHLASQVPLSGFGWTELLMVARSYWAAFGWAPILVEPPVYVAAGLVLLVGLAGILVAVYPGGSFSSRKRARWGAAWDEPATTRRGLALLGLAFALNLVSLVGWATGTGAPAGRLLFPTLPAAAVLAAWGLSQWSHVVLFRWGAGAAVGLAFILAAVVPWRYLRPAYAHPRLPRGVPDSAETVDLAFDGGVRLSGYEPLMGDLEPGESLRLTLYWYTPTSPGQRYRSWVQLASVDPTRKVADADVWLGGTLYPSELWQAGDTVKQVYPLHVAEWASAPALYWIRVGLVDGAGDRVALADWDAKMLTLGPWRMRAVADPPAPGCTSDYRVGPAIRLVGYDLAPNQETGEVALTLHWRTDEVPGADYTVFVHLMDGEGRLLGQHDGPPRDGAYPTSWWLPGDTVLDRHVIHLDSAHDGAIRLRVGMYDPATMVRLPVYDEAGRRLPEDVIPLPAVASSQASCVLPAVVVKVTAHG